MKHRPASSCCCRNEVGWVRIIIDDCSEDGPPIFSCVFPQCVEFDYDCVGMVKMGLSENIPPKFNGPSPFSPLKSTVRGIHHFRQTQIPLGKFNIAMEHIGKWPCFIGSKSSTKGSFSIAMSRSVGARSVWLCEGTRNGPCQRSAARNARLPPTQVPSGHGKVERTDFRARNRVPKES